jgi:DNA relaxase NicK
LLSEANITQTLTKVVAVDPLELRIARFDATADVTSGITMGHIRGGLQVRHKRKTKEYVNGVVANHRFETMYFGEANSASFIRAYDKARQLESSKRMSPASPWVRMEHVVQGRAIPANLKTLGAFFRHGANFELFNQIEFVGMPDEVDPSLI